MTRSMAGGTKKGKAGNDGREELQQGSLIKMIIDPGARAKQKQR